MKLKTSDPITDPSAPLTEQELSLAERVIFEEGQRLWQVTEPLRKNIAFVSRHWELIKNLVPATWVIQYNYVELWETYHVQIGSDVVFKALALSECHAVLAFKKGEWDMELDKIATAADKMIKAKYHDDRVASFIAAAAALGLDAEKVLIEVKGKKTRGPKSRLSKEAEQDDE